MALRSILRRIQSASTGVWLFRGKSKRLSLIVSRTNAFTKRKRIRVDGALKGFFHPGCLARVVSLFASVSAIFMVHGNGDEQRQAKR